MSRVRRLALVPLILLPLLLGLLLTMSGPVVDYLWFHHLGLGFVHDTIVGTRLLLFAVGAVVTGVFLSFNAWLAFRLSPRRPSLQFTERAEFILDQLPPNRFIRPFLAFLVVAVAFMLGLNLSDYWLVLQSYLHRLDTGSIDPIFHLDLGFYLFELPFYLMVKDFVLYLLTVAIIGVLGLYLLSGALFQRGRGLVIEPGVRAHLLVLAALLLFLETWSYWLGRYQILFFADDTMHGAGYADVHAQLPAYAVVAVLLAIAGLIQLVGAVRGGAALPALGFGLALGGVVLVSNGYPAVIQWAVVNPNELDKEREFLAHHIAFTRRAYGLDRVRVEEFPALSRLEPQHLEEYRNTLENLALWDRGPLLEAFRQEQELRSYYAFDEVDLDRYLRDGTPIQVAVAARELRYDKLPEEAQRWLNRHFQYTHGYGLVVSPVGQRRQSGDSRHRPEYLLKDIPLATSGQAPAELRLSNPRIYYGEQTTHPVFVGTGLDEFDFPRGDQNAFFRYDGAGGLPAGGLWRRVLLSFYLGTYEVLHTSYLNDGSRLLINRQVRERVREIAPFLRYEEDPYLIAHEGRLKWVIDAYTSSEFYPYAKPYEEGLNYLRNSVKAVIDAYSGAVTLYAVDLEDPILRVYRAIFPGLFVDGTRLAEDDPELFRHFRYPRQLFTIQASLLADYHMQDPQTFYAKEDSWELPSQLYAGQEQPLQPYYQVLHLPGERSAEFVLFLPFIPAGQQNLVGWLAARCDGPGYGELRLYTLPKGRLQRGPMQVESMFEQTDEVARLLGTLSRSGAEIFRGNLLCVPIAGSFLYVEPIYLQSQKQPIAQLSHVIVWSGEGDPVVATSLWEGLRRLLAPTTAHQSPVPVGGAGLYSSRVSALVDALEQARQARRDGAWSELGGHLDQVEDGLGQLEVLTIWLEYTRMMGELGKTLSGAAEDGGE